MTVYFYNQEPLNLNLVRLMGLSVKDTSNPIGYFGTGLKYAIAVLLREQHRVKFLIEGAPYTFTLREETIRGKSFERVYMNDEGLGFTSELGKNWKVWQAYRELASNAYDEAGDVSSIAPSATYGTVIEVRGAAIEEARVDHHKIFLDRTRWPIHKTDYVEIFHVAPTDAHGIYNRGVRAGEVPSLYTYNFANARLTEDRGLADTWTPRYHIANAIMSSTDEDFLRNVLFAPPATFESGFIFGEDLPNSETFYRVIGENRNKLGLNESAKKLWFAKNKSEPEYETITLNVREASDLNAAKHLLAKLDIDYDRLKVFFVASLGAGVDGLAKGSKIYIPRSTFHRGYRFLASTLYEEYLHVEHGLSDESRGFQNHILDQLFAVLDR